MENIPEQNEIETSHKQEADEIAKGQIEINEELNITLQQKIEQLDAKMAKIDEEGKAQVSAQQKIVAITEIHEREMNKLQQNSNQTVSDLQKELEHLKERHDQELQRIKEENDEAGLLLQKQMTDKDTEINDLKRKIEDSSVNKEYQDKIRDLKEKVTHSRAQTDLANGKSKTLEKDAKLKEQTILKLKSEISSDAKTIKQYKEYIDVKDAQIQKLNENVKESDTKILHDGYQIVDFEEEIAANKTLMESQKKQIIELQAKTTNYEQLQKNIKIQQHNIQQLKKTTEELKNQAKKALEECESLTEESATTKTLLDESIQKQQEASEHIQQQQDIIVQQEKKILGLAPLIKLLRAKITSLNTDLENRQVKKVEQENIVNSIKQKYESYAEIEIGKVLDKLPLLSKPGQMGRSGSTLKLRESSVPLTQKQLIDLAKHQPADGAESPEMTQNIDKIEERRMTIKTKKRYSSVKPPRTISAKRFSKLPSIKNSLEELVEENPINNWTFDGRTQTHLKLSTYDIEAKYKIEKVFASHQISPKQCVTLAKVNSRKSLGMSARLPRSIQKIKQQRFSLKNNFETYLS